MDRDGRYAGLMITTGWRDRIGPDGLPDAIVHAGARARELWTETAGVAEERGTATDVGDRTDWLDEISEAFDEMTPAGQDEALFAMAGLLGTVTGELDERLERIREQEDARFTGADGRGYVAVTLTAGGLLSAVELDQKWLPSAGIQRLVAAAREALFEAQRARDVAIDAVRNDTPAADATRRLVTEPGGVRRLAHAEEPDLAGPKGMGQ